MRDSEILSYIDLSPNKDRGILKRIIQESQIDAQPVDFDRAVVHLIGTYFGGENHGKTFYSTRDSGKPFQYVVDNCSVIKSFDIAIKTMKIGEICELIVSPEYAYEDGKALRFEIELLDAYGQNVMYGMKNIGGLRSSIVSQSSICRHPSVGFNVTVHYRCLTDPNDVGIHDVRYIFGDPNSASVPDYIDKVVFQMNEGCISRLNIYENDSVSKYESGRRKSIYIVHLIAVETMSAPANLSDYAEQQSFIEQLKEKADKFYEVGKNNLALNVYENIYFHLEKMFRMLTPVETFVVENMIFSKMKMAHIKLKMNKTDESMLCCRDVLKLDANNEEALFFLGEAELTRRNVENAKKYFSRVVKINSSNMAAVNNLRSCEETITRQAAEENELFRRGFARARMVNISDYNNNA